MQFGSLQSAIDVGVSCLGYLTVGFEGNQQEHPPNFFLGGVPEKKAQPCGCWLVRKLL